MMVLTGTGIDCWSGLGRGEDEGKGSVKRRKNRKNYRIKQF
jgi:hypothetical protein